MQVQHGVASIAPGENLAADYMMGRSEHERQRILTQSNILREWTRDFFTSAGLSAGMRVLDIGSGMGDVSLLVAEIVGPTGSVAGIDWDPVVVEQARQRAQTAGLAERVRFAVTDIDTFDDARPFDAVVGRYILAHVSDPVATLRHVTNLVRPAGVVVFHEPDIGTATPAYPVAPLWEHCYALMGELCLSLGKPADIGKRLTRVFLDAGLPLPTVRAVLPVGGGHGSYLYGWLADTLKSMLPSLERAGVIRADELQVDTLAERLEAEAVALGCQVMCSAQYGAWTTVGLDD